MVRIGFILKSAILVAVINLLPSAALANDVLRAQIFLRTLGLDPGPVDGAWGGRTGAALGTFLENRGLDAADRLDDSHIDALFDALRETNLNGIARSELLSVSAWQTDYGNTRFDFQPPVDLPSMLPQVTELQPFGTFAARISERIQPWDVQRHCNWVFSERFPDPQPSLRTYASAAAADSAGRMPFDGNRWFEDMSFYSARAGAAIAANNTGPVMAFKRALLDHATQGSALDQSGLLARGRGTVIFTPDLASAVQATTSITINYLIAKEALGLSPEEAETIETWLDRLFETYTDSYWVLNGRAGLKDPRALDLVGRGVMANALLRGDAAQFNLGADLATTAIAFTREDGSHRFGASRGNRAVYYQGVALTTGLETLVILSSQIPEARDILAPTLSQQAAFLAAAWQDGHAAILPYALENNGVVRGSNYRSQDRLDVIPAGIELLLKLEPDHPETADLAALQARHPWSTNYSEALNATCAAYLLAEN